MIDFAYWIG